MALPKYLFEATDSQLAMELAAQLSPTSDIMERYDMKKKDLAKKFSQEAFKSLYQEAKAYWNSNANTQERIRMKSQMMLEDSLLVLYRAAHDVDASITSRLDAVDKISVLADAKPKRDAAQESAGSKFHLTLNLPGRTLTVDAPVLPEAIEGEVLSIESGV